MSNLLISTGFSIKPNIDEAVREAFEQARERLDGEPALILAFSSYNKYTNYNSINEALKLFLKVDLMLASQLQENTLMIKL